jgi:hypothetical protein
MVTKGTCRPAFLDAEATNYAMRAHPPLASSLPDGPITIFARRTAPIAVRSRFGRAIRML